MPSALRSRRIQVQDSFQAIQDYCWEQGWTDGLPVVPPTEDLVRGMLQGYGEDPSTSLGLIHPRNAQVTLEKVAINAVMAGCQPEHFPVVAAAETEGETVIAVHGYGAHLIHKGRGFFAGLTPQHININQWR